MSSPINRDTRRVETDRSVDVPPSTSSPPSQRWYYLAWMVVVIGLLVWLAIGTVSTTSYSYNMFVQSTFRNVTDEPVQQIWAHQARNLPTVELQSLLDGAFVAAIVTIVGGVVAGSWLLLVKAAQPVRRQRNHRRPTPTQSI